MCIKCDLLDEIYFKIWVLLGFLMGGGGCMDSYVGGNNYGRFFMGVCINCCILIIWILIFLMVRLM